MIPIKLSAGETVRILDFSVDVGGHRNVGGKRIAFIEAPRKLPVGRLPVHDDVDASRAARS